MWGVTVLPQLPPGLCRAGTQPPGGTSLRCGSQGPRSLLEGEPRGALCCLAGCWCVRFPPSPTEALGGLGHRGGGITLGAITLWV